jgi:hypothetical protein
MLPEPAVTDIQERNLVLKPLTPSLQRREGVLRSLPPTVSRAVVSSRARAFTREGTRAPRRATRRFGNRCSIH